MKLVEEDLQKPRTKEENLELLRRRDSLLGVISDSYRRMATNPAMYYRSQQLAKCDGYLRELTELYQLDPILFNLSREQLT